MALIILDPCDIGFKAQEDGGIIQIVNIEGFPEGLALMLPLTEKSLESLFKKVDQKLKAKEPRIEVADLATARKEAQQHGLHDSE